MNSKQLPGCCVNHPDRPAVAGCQHCGDFLCPECAGMVVAGICVTCAGRGVEDSPPAVWEQNRRPGNIVKIIWGVLSRPGEFFGGMPHGRGAWYAFLYAGLVLFVSAALTTLVQLFIRGGSLPWHVMLNVLGLAGLLLLDTAAIFVLGRLYHRKLPFPDVLRVVSYSATAYIFLIVPIFGPLLVLALILVYLTLGSHRGLHLGIVQSVSLALLPLVIRLAAAWIIYGGRFIQLVTG